ncbi:hypothetical protein Zmor_028183 [Zophobas morio]|uniref:Short-chain dehydrogenase/reductase 3 n=1 Tax=Zophobas morio TaxID=2755281 RepID=A0AA38HQJ8_9CUCU|nr:hypothetical protein Zmor_028183 [Zophobas morio]
MADIASTVKDICLLWIKFVFALGKAAYRKVVPVQLKPVKGEIVLVTGAGHGIGKELAFLYASEGATVVAWDVNTKTNQETVSEINQRGYKAYAYHCDVTKREQVFEVAKKVRQEVGRVTILVNNAGIMPAKTLLDHTQEEIERIFALNVLAHHWTIQAFLPDMKKNNHGHIVAISSIAGLMGSEYVVPYCSTKFAVVALMEALQQELRLEKVYNVGFTTVCPYVTDTGLCKKPKIKFSSVMAMLNPADVAKAVMKAQRTNEVLVTVPKYLLYLVTFTRLFPYEVGVLVRDFFDSGLYADS